ncbi:acyl transferase/acyl hydrolase/lysophospholipase [Bisporella sp. PMI_857]|nr:acyl transferase/acyl hydrolase/lysophospholipase [Bisporella sp. PMI_857]
MSQPEKKRILCMDSGGVRSLSILLILRRIMRRLEGDKLHFPHKWFDIIAGTGTGGLIAIMLGRLHMDIESCIEAYCDLSRRVFSSEHWTNKSEAGKIIRGINATPAFKARDLEEEVKKIVNEFVCTTQLRDSQKVRLRTYGCEWEEPETCNIWEAARATSAAPMFFEPVEFKGSRVRYVDGGIWRNNPVRELYREAYQLLGARSVSCIISIGTGVLEVIDIGGNGMQLLEACKSIVTETEETANDFAREVMQEGRQSRIYFRFNVSNGLQKVGLTEYAAVDLMTQVTRSYLGLLEVEASLKECTDTMKDESPHREGSGSLSKVPGEFSTVTKGPTPLFKIASSNPKTGSAGGGFQIYEVEEA